MIGFRVMEEFVAIDPTANQPSVHGFSSAGPKFETGLEV
jgi:hypothetical protein